VFAVAASPPLSNQELSALAAPLAAAGTDKLLLCESDEFTVPADDSRQGRALDAAVARVPPMFVLFPAGGVGSVLGPPLAARVGGPFAPWVDFVVSEATCPAADGRSRVQVLRLRPDGRSQRRLDPAQIERPIIVTVCAGRSPVVHGTERSLEIEVLPVPPRPTRAAPVTLARAPNPFASLQEASVLVLLGEGESSREDVLATLSAEAGAGFTVARVADVPAAVLAGCCPEVVVKVGRSGALTARAPRTRIVLAAALSPDELPPDDVDVVWPVASPAELSGLLRNLGNQV
jgi:electron transfer flavoprotein alpha subunit